ncbi:hypothetical protein FEM48_Zijuj11G0054200 [Ziziphus jujuba var. spinosa]|uniref:Pectinesterase inhibitor domain-containing protein n=1 Tax=Ziziphus jujuba var. spinosa TaxID=714518 RepID=A0A978UH32_ZIZJJ|nr:hypothetical protein FEM48_Zijuj11G0054200 [Ziziphus jujuba var. spinosa]
MGGPSCSMNVLVALLLILQFSTVVNPTSDNTTTPLLCKADTKYIRRSCRLTTYPKLCYNSLSIFAGKIKTDSRLLAHAALNVSLGAAIATSVTMNRLSRINGLNPIVAAAVQDCVELIDDSVYELKNSVSELGRARRSQGPDFELQMNNIQTWASAALTDADTCMDGFGERNMNGRVKNAVRRHIVKVEHLTSNALALINNYVSAKSASP